MQLSGRTVLVTGGASGLGAATVDMLVAAGGRAVVIDLNDEGGRAKEASHRGAVRFVKGDVAVEAEVQRAIDVAISDLGGMHGLVNVAGIPAAERVLPKDGVQPLAHFERVIPRAGPLVPDPNPPLSPAAFAHATAPPESGGFGSGTVAAADTLAAPDPVAAATTSAR